MFFFSWAWVLGQVLWDVTVSLFVNGWHRVYDVPYCLTSRDGLPFTGLVAIVTGANTGIGRATAQALAVRGATVVLACRSTERGQRAVKAIRESVPDSQVFCMELDLASLDSVRQFAADFKLRFSKLNLLINNAGVGGGGSGGVTADGLELCFGVNYLGHYLLTMLLLPRLRDGHLADDMESRVVNLSSVMHFLADSKHWPATPEAKDAALHRATDRQGDGGEYARSKLFMVVFALELNRRLEAAGEYSIVAHSVNPGAVNSDIWRNAPQRLQPLVHTVFPAVFKTNEQGALTVLAACIRNDLAPGTYLVDRKPAPSSPRSLDPELGEWLWSKSKELTGTGMPPLSS